MFILKYSEIIADKELQKCWGFGERKKYLLSMDGVHSKALSGACWPPHCLPNPRNGDGVFFLALVKTGVGVAGDGDKEWAMISLY